MAAAAATAAAAAATAKTTLAMARLGANLHVCEQKTQTSARSLTPRPQSTLRIVFRVSRAARTSARAARAAVAGVFR